MTKYTCIQMERRMDKVEIYFHDHIEEETPLSGFLE
jgi:hypothetical protein